MNTFTIKTMMHGQEITEEGLTEEAARATLEHFFIMGTTGAGGGMVLVRDEGVPVEEDEGEEE